MSGQIPGDKARGKQQVRMPAAEDDPLVAEWKSSIEGLFIDSPTFESAGPVTPDAASPCQRLPLRNASES
jgi:hypothetical protein